MAKQPRVIRDFRGKAWSRCHAGCGLVTGFTAPTRTQALKRVVGHAEDVVNGIVVEATDAGAARACRFRLEIQHLADDARLPEKVTVERRPELMQARVEVGDHAEAEEAVGRNVLIAAHARREAPAIAVR